MFDPGVCWSGLTAEQIGEKLSTVQQWGKTGCEPKNTMPTRIIMALIDRIG